MNKTFTINLTGELTIKRASQIQQMFAKALNENDKVQVVLDNPESLDLTCVQLLHFATQSAKAAAKQFALSTNLSSDIRDLLEKAGFNAF